MTTPHAYPIKHVEGRFAFLSNGWTVIEFGHRGEPTYIDTQRVHYAFWAEVPPTAFGATPLVRFLDWHGNLYYQYQHYTGRFVGGTDWLDAIRQLDEWIRGQSDGDTGVVSV